MESKRTRRKRAKRLKVRELRQQELGQQINTLSTTNQGVLLLQDEKAHAVHEQEPLCCLLADGHYCCSKVVEDKVMNVDIVTFGFQQFRRSTFTYMHKNHEYMAAFYESNNRVFAIPIQVDNQEHFWAANHIDKENVAKEIYSLALCSHCHAIYQKLYKMCYNSPAIPQECLDEADEPEKEEEVEETECLNPPVLVTMICSLYKNDPTFETSWMCKVMTESVKRLVVKSGRQEWPMEFIHYALTIQFYGGGRTLDKVCGKAYQGQGSHGRLISDPNLWTIPLPANSTLREYVQVVNPYQGCSVQWVNMLYQSISGSTSVPTSGRPHRKRKRKKKKIPEQSTEQLSVVAPLEQCSILPSSLTTEGCSTVLKQTTADTVPKTIKVLLSFDEIDISKGLGQDCYHNMLVGGVTGILNVDTATWARVD